jgi:hypothetical protein
MLYVGEVRFGVNVSAVLLVAGVVVWRNWMHGATVSGTYAIESERWGVRPGRALQVSLPPDTVKFTRNVSSWISDCGRHDDV